ncbi:hypothetical protein GCM10007938_28440 [Vibrio zhanjiangensis]|uniref:Uncharacterized protein n=1 Tax=Vibrio zhanjiangensis TaxID=1046128 RepID=A0ABQ6F2Y9_9VIBR|nr:hypothetical protein [Vibrio zhanjiangensis]GLT19062.1 hypothetical protein GCM10007938_28440 [Vibrio zhanjiangensis]
MTKSLCKMSRKQIADGLTDIHRLVAEPKFVCRSCARSSAEKGLLCKPAAIPPLSCQNQPLERQKKCGLLSEALVLNAPPKPQSGDRSRVVKKVIDQVKQKAQNKPSDASGQWFESLASSKDIKRAKKALKKHYKQQKALLKLAKKKHKLQKREAKLRLRIRPELPQLVDGKKTAQTSKVH